MKSISPENEKYYEPVIDSKVIHNGNFLKLIKDTVKLPDGSTSTREYIIHNGAAMIIPILKNGNLLLINQYRHPLKKYFVEFPAGKIDLGETSLSTAHRELLEETGFTTTHLEKIYTIHPVIGYSNEFIDFYLARNLEFKGHKREAGEHMEMFEMSFSELKNKILKNEISDAKTIVGAFILESLLPTIS